jgi:hypothetical protein
MVKLYIIFVGLISIIAPTRPNDPYKTLLLRVDENVTASDGVVIPSHVGKAFFRPKGYDPDELAFWLFEQEDLTLGASSEGTPRLNGSQFVEFNSILGSNVRVKPGCLGANPQRDCLSRGRPALSGRVNFFGGEINPLSVSEADILSGTLTLARGPNDVMGFRSLRFPDIKSDHLKAAANGGIYSRQVPANFSIDFGSGNTFPLDLAPASKCLELGAEAQCFVVTIINGTTPTLQHDNQSDDGANASASRDIDRHFELFYDLIEPAQLIKFVPYRRFGPLQDSHDPPEARCIPPIIRD